ncbi:MAG TPA: VWA domain-containing protein [Pyrinomonadaceae bacterium]|jgi:VWFA-related protein|nr:VWA domain-containing protein [Pyrinomonadaceae bacterium]
MRKTVSPLAALALLCAPAIFALTQPRQQPQTPAPAAATPTPAPRATQSTQATPTPPVEIDEEEVVRITTNLVQLDAIVTDKHGKQVTDLKAEDFEVFEDGKPQKITNFSYVATETPAAAIAAKTPAAKPDKNAPPAPPAPPRRLRPEQVRRAVAIVVDDLQLSASDLVFARRAVRQYVDKYVAPDDLVAVIRTSAGVGALQQFTSDRRALHAAIERIKPFLMGSGGLSTFAPATGSSPIAPISGVDSADSGNELESFRQEYFTVGTLGALNFVINGMRELPGRKSVVLLSPGFRLQNPDDPRGQSDRALVAARRLIDLANRASVVIYGIDPRGLVYTGPTAADNLSGMSGQQIGDLMSARSQQLSDTQGGLQYLAEQTGGFSVRNSNELLPASRILEDLRGYYLIGYRPRGETFDRRFHRLSVKLVNRSDLKLRTRKGFYGVSTEQIQPARRTPQQKFIAALLSPFASGDVRLRLTAAFTNTQQTGSVLSALMHADARDIRFTKQADGQYEAHVDVFGATFSDTGLVVDQHGITQTWHMPEDVYQRILRDGIVYRINVPIKKSGAYQLRVALRDTATEKIGSASQFVEVPDLKKDRLTLSGIIMNGAAARTAGQASEGAAETEDAQSSPAVRRFRQRSLVDYTCVVYNARTDKAAGRPRVSAQTRLFRDGQLVFAGTESPIQPAAGGDPKRIVFGGRLALGTDLPPGDYTLQIVVNDQLRDDKRRAATQWIDFEIVK